MTRRQTALLLALAAVWGGSYALIKVALDDGMPWAWVAFARVVLGALVMTTIAVRRLGARALMAGARWTGAVGVVQIGLPFLLIAWAERRLASGLAGVLIATAPLFTVLLAARFAPDTPLERRGLVGVVIGFAGVVLLFGADLSGDADAIVAGLALVLAAFGYGVGSTLARSRLGDVPAVVVSAAALLWASAITGVAALASGTPPVPSAGTIVALCVLGAVGTGVAFLVFFTLIAEVGPSRTILVTYLAPVFAVGYGAAFLDERITAGVVVGIVLVIGGSLLGTRRAARGGTGPPDSAVRGPA